MVSGSFFHCRKNSWPPEEYVSRNTLQLFDFDSAGPPEHAWRRRLNSHANILKEFSITFMEAIKMVRLGIRMWSYVREEASHGRKAPIDPFTRESCKPSASQGVPLGGMGSGSISRGFRGEFRQWQIIPGLCEASPVMANQFSIFISRDGGNKNYASVLAPGQHEGLGPNKKFDDQGISSWGWNLSGQQSTYHALFPRAWTIYDGEPDPELKVSCRQISPFIPHNYRESSLPVAVFVYTLVNTGKERAKVSLLFTWANSIGGISHLSGDHVNEPFIAEDGVSGILLHHKTAKGNPPATFAIAASETQNVNVSVLPYFGLTEGSSVTAKDMWCKMAQDGQFDRENFNSGPCVPSSPGETLCAAVSASAWVEPHGRCTVAFALAWSSPKVKFVKGSTFNRRYTKFYGTSERAAEDLVHDALTNYKQWEEEIERWQSPILKDSRLPEWYKFTLFNELYFLVAGGTIWIDTSSLTSQKRDETLPVVMGNVDFGDAEGDLNGGHAVVHKVATTVGADFRKRDVNVRLRNSFRNGCGVPWANGHSSRRLRMLEPHDDDENSQPSLQKMDNMHSFWQLGDELRGQTRASEDQKWVMAASKLAEQTRSKGERFNNLDLSKAPAETRSRDKFGYQEDSKFENINFNMLNMDTKYTETMSKNSFRNGMYNLNEVYPKSSVNLVENMATNKYSGKIHNKDSNNNSNRNNSDSNENNANNAADKRFKTLPATETLPRNEVLGGYIFVCNNDTMQEDLKRQLFGLPPRYRDSVRAITPGLPLFLYNYSTHQLHGIFEAASFGGSNIDPTAWEDKKCKGESRFPAQVRIHIRKLCKALEEDAFRPVLHHYDGPKFRLELSVPETLALLDLCEQEGSAA